jgi:hypothetical protein
MTALFFVPFCVFRGHHRGESAQQTFAPLREIDRSSTDKL